tara:strand:+ start:7903 stop:8184 length:282 start_codon:yes stop_codon:yes gene_type:complete
MKPVEILETASGLVGGERAEQHGDFKVLHRRVAALWSTYLGTDVRPDQVAFCMVLLKLSRNEVGSHNPDDGVDATAYAALWSALSEDRSELCM